MGKLDLTLHESMAARLRWKRLIAQPFQSAFLRNVLVLSGGTLAGQMIVVTSTPLLTRLYTPEEIGVFAVYLSIVSVLTTIAALRYEVVIPLPRDEEQAAQVFGLSCCCVLGTSACAWLILYFTHAQFARWTGYEELFAYWWLVPLGLVASGTQAILNTWSIRQRFYKSLASAGIIQAVAQTAIHVCAGLLAVGSWGLLIGDAAGRACYAVPLWRRRSSSGYEMPGKITIRGMRTAAVRYWRFPVISIWAALLNSVSFQLPLLLFAMAYDLEVVGWLALAQRVLGMPTVLLSNSVGKVFFKECASLRHEAPQELPRLFWKTLASQTVFAGALLVFVAMPAPLVVGWLFGNAWQAAGWFVVVLSLAYAVRLVAKPLSFSLDVLEQQGSHLVREVSRLVLTGAAVTLAATLQWSPLAAISLFSLTSCVGYCLDIFLSWKAIQHEASASPAKLLAA